MRRPLKAPDLKTDARILCKISRDLGGSAAENSDKPCCDRKLTWPAHSNVCISGKPSIDGTICAKNASLTRHLWVNCIVDRCLSCPCRSPSHRTDYQVEIVSVQLRRLVKVVEGGLISLLIRLSDDCRFFFAFILVVFFVLVIIVLRILEARPWGDKAGAN